MSRKTENNRKNRGRTERTRRSTPSRSGVPVKSVRRFTFSMQKKLVVLFGVVLLAFIGLGIRVFLISRNNGDEYRRQVLSQQSFESTTLPYRRGKILDSKGTVLADSQLVYNVIVDAKVILDKDYYLEPTLDAIEQLGVDREEVAEYIQEHPKSQYYIALKDLPYQDKKNFEDMISAGIEQEVADKIPVKERVYNNIKGIWFEDSYIRTYPQNTLAADVIGFAGKDNIGVGGLEEYYNSTLNGSEGRSYGYLDDTAMVETRTIAAVDGNNLVLSLDSTIQEIVENKLADFNAYLKNNYRRGNGTNNTACVIQDIHTGNILAMASSPGFDLNNPRDLNALVGMPVLNQDDTATNEYLTEKDVAKLSDEDISRYLNKLWGNFCIGEHYEPGSVSKPFTVAAGLETGTVGLNETFYCAGSYTVEDSKIACHEEDGHGTINVSQAIEGSCNVALMHMGLEVGAQNFRKFQDIFNFGLKTNIDLAAETRTSQFLYDADKMSSVDLATNAFGQNFEVTMIQMISAFSSIVNGGNYYQPNLVTQITSPTGAVVENIEPQLLKRTVSEDTSAQLKEYLLQVVEGAGGTGKSARPYGYRIGGKTGTAETLPRRNGEYIVSFIGYAPADDPKIAIYVVVDRPNVEKQDDATLATNLTRVILQDVLPYLDCPMTETLTPEEAAYLDEQGIAYTTQVVAEVDETEFGNE